MAQQRAKGGARRRPPPSDAGAAAAPPELPVAHVRWTKAFRIVATRWPPVQLFERIADPSQWELLAEVESLTNPRVRDAIGEALAVPVAERVSGPGASFVMAPFAHPRPSRFSDGSFGVYYCARERLTAVRETAFHMGCFHAATQEAPLDFDMRVLVGRVDQRLHDLRAMARAQTDPLAVLDPDDYAQSQRLGARLRAGGSSGVVYPSVRHAGGTCIGAFRPRAIAVPALAEVLTYHWNGSSVDRWFDHAAGTWHDV